MFSTNINVMNACPVDDPIGDITLTFSVWYAASDQEAEGIICFVKNLLKSLVDWFCRLVETETYSSIPFDLNTTTKSFICYCNGCLSQYFKTIASLVGNARITHDECLFVKLTSNSHQTVYIATHDVELKFIITWPMVVTREQASRMNSTCTSL